MTALDWVGQDQHGRRLILAELLAKVSREAVQGDGLNAVLQRIVDCVVDRVPVAVASIILLNQENTFFVAEFIAGDFELETPVPMPWSVALGAAGRCARTGLPRLIANVDHDPDYISGNPAVRSEYLLPILYRDRLHGILNLESTRDDFFTPPACAVFDAVAEHIAGAVHLNRVTADLEAANRKLEHLSMSDGLTGIANRRCFDQRLQTDWERLADGGRMLALALVDADRFKPLNDACGHLYGDECLRQLAQLCTEVARGPEDLVARFGGEELMLLLPDRTLDEACNLAEQLRRKVESARMDHPDSPSGPYVTVSVGVSALQPTRLQSPKILIAAADGALYAAKARGRNRVTCNAAHP